MNVSSFTSKGNDLQGTKSFPHQEIESYSNSTKIMGAEEMHMIRAQWTENGPGEPDQWLHLLQLKKESLGLFKPWAAQYNSNTMGLSQSDVFQRRYLEYFISVISV